MKILHAIQGTDPTRGGPIEGIVQIGLATQGVHEHHIVSLDSPHAPHLQSIPMPVTALGPGSVLGYSAALVPWLENNLKRFDLVVIHGLWRYISFGSWRALRDSSTPYLVMPHGMLDPWFKQRYPFKHAKKWMFWPWTEYRVLRDAKAVVFTCDEERRLARESFWLYRCNERVGTVGISGPSSDLSLAREHFFRDYPLLRGKRILLFLGRIHEKKGCDLLIQAFAEMAARDSDLHLVMAGPCHDGLGAKLKALAANHGRSHRVTWPGMLTGELKWGAFAASEAFILPSHQENFGIAVAEALSCGLPVVISNKVQIWREIDQDQAGIVGDDTLEGTKESLARWLGLDRDKRAGMSRRARRCYESRFDSRCYAQTMSRIYEEAVAPA
ncbi:MAG: glycosyltransferase [Burkholderiales bacterium]